MMNGIILSLCCLIVGASAASSPPLRSDGPGWLVSPQSVTTKLGRFAVFSCHNKFSHTTIWLVNGTTNIKQTPYVSKATITVSQNRHSRLRYGPVTASDSGLSFICEVITTTAGTIPSVRATLNILRPSSYTPAPNQVGFIGKPFYLRFQYSGSPPTQVYMYKNGVPYQETPGRVSFDHRGITFTKLNQEDAGEYRVRAWNTVGRASDSVVLRVIYWWSNGSSMQHAAQNNSKLPVSIAVKIAITEAKVHPILPTRHPSFRLSSVDSTVHSERILRILNNRASVEAIGQGRSREETERILRRVVTLVGFPVKHLDDDDADKIGAASDCSLIKKTYNCRRYSVLVYRTINGTCNNLFYPLNGAANVPLARLLPANYQDGISTPHSLVQNNPFSPPWPSPRKISSVLMNDLDLNSTGLTLMFMQWGQFLDHDIDISPVFPEENCACERNTECLPIPVEPTDPQFGARTPHRGRCLRFTRSIPACTHPEHRSNLPRNQINQITSYIDASNVYGSEDELAKRLRLFAGGLLKEGSKTHSSKANLPVQEERPDNGTIPFFEAGDERANEQTGLTVMHTIWMREHNRIARNLARLNPCWGDEKIYQETRKIVGGMAQAITYNEFLPALFGPHYRTFVPAYKRYNPFVDSTIPNEFSTAAFRFGHSLVRPFLLRLDKNFQPIPEGPLPLERAFFDPMSYYESNGTDPILRGLLVANPRSVDEFLTNILTSKLFTEDPNKFGMDLASLNIQRGRDHGLPSYRSIQKFCASLFPGTNSSFQYETSNDKLKQLYGEDGYRDGMDLWVGGLSEKQLPGAQVGPTFACIMGLTFQRIRDGDRFWYQHPFTFGRHQRREISKATLSKLICTNADDIDSVQPNAFRADQPRVACSSLPRVDLRFWRDRRCYSYYFGYRYNRRG